jgi:hypothetical protein
MIVVAALLAFVVGALAGSVALAHWWVWRTNHPEVAQAMLKSLYRKAHPSWLQISEHDTTRVCPCCGWSDTETLAPGIARCKPKD